MVTEAPVDKPWFVAVVTVAVVVANVIELIAGPTNPGTMNNRRVEATDVPGTFQLNRSTRQPSAPAWAMAAKLVGAVRDTSPVATWPFHNKSGVEAYWAEPDIILLLEPFV